MNEFEFKVKLAEEIIEERKEVNEKYLALQVDNVKQLRNLIIQFIIISSAVIGFSLPVLDNKNLVVNPFFLVSGMTTLLIVVIYGFFYLTRLLQKENNDLKLHSDAFNEFLNKKRAAKILFMKNIKIPGSLDKYEEAQKKALEELDRKIKKTKEGKDYSLDIIFSAFFIGLTFIVISLINFQTLLNNIKTIIYICCN